MTTEEERIFVAARCGKTGATEEAIRDAVAAGDPLDADAEVFDPFGLTDHGLPAENRVTAKPTETAPPGDARHGERLRELAEDTGFGCTNEVIERMKAIADAIDRDAGDQLASLAHDFAKERADLRRRVEELVEELKYSTASSLGPTGSISAARDILDIEDLLARLAGIFGQRAEGPPRSKPGADARWFEVPGRDGARGLRVAIQLDGQTYLWPLDPEVGQGFALSSDAARDLEMILRSFLPGDFALAGSIVPSEG